MRLAHSGDNGLAIGGPDDDCVNFLLDQIFDLGNLAGHVATGVQHHGLDIGVFFGRSDEGLLIGRLIAVDAHVVLRDADLHRLGGRNAAPCDKRGGRGKCIEKFHFSPPRVTSLSQGRGSPAQSAASRASVD